ncbi:MAG: hypothetical protein ACLPVF_18685 [Acidimicrobiales bacterium]
MGKLSRLAKVCAMSIVLGACAPLVLLSIRAKRVLEYRLVPLARLLRSVGVRLSYHRDSWTREITLFEVLTGEMARRSRR